MKVVDEQTVMAHAELIVEAATRFRATANFLVRRLAACFNVPVEALADEQGSMDSNTFQKPFEEDWGFDFHGDACRFSNLLTGQVLDVQMCFGTEFGVLDPFFFGEFIRTTPEFKGLVSVLPEAYHDTARALDVLAESGWLTRIPPLKERQQGILVKTEEEQAFTQLLRSQ